MIQKVLANQDEFYHGDTDYCNEEVRVSGSDICNMLDNLKINIWSFFFPELRNKPKVLGLLCKHSNSELNNQPPIFMDIFRDK